MNFWITLWSGVLLVSLLVFALLAVVVTVGGWFDIRALFTGRDRRDDEPV